MKPETVFNAVIALCLIFLTWAVGLRVFNEFERGNHNMQRKQVPTLSLPRRTDESGNNF